MGLHKVMPDILITCPLDESHRILKSRMQFHLVRCLKNHKLDGKKLKCPWNPLHIIDHFVYEDHCNNKCEDLPNVMGSRVLFEDDAAHRDVASIPLGAVNAVLPEVNEDWDAEPCSMGTYDPSKRAVGLPVLRSQVGLSKAKKKAWIQAERKRHQELENILPLQTRPLSKPLENIVNVATPRRQPRTLQVAMSADASMIDDLNASRMSEETENSLPLPTSLRPPRTRSQYSLYDAAKSVEHDETRSESVTSFDECYGYDESKSNGTRTASGSRQDSNVPDSDARSSVSTTSARSSKIDELRKALAKQMPKKSFASVASSGSSKNDTPKEKSPKDETSLLQDEEAASRPITAEPQNNDVGIEQLLDRLLNLTTLDSRSFEDEKATLITQISKLQHTSNHSQHNDKKKIDNCKVKQGISKCAANFPKLIKPENSSAAASVSEVDDQKNSKVSSTLNNSNPFV